MVGSARVAVKHGLGGIQRGLAERTVRAGACWHRPVPGSVASTRPVPGSPEQTFR